jgi:putative transposase
MKKKRFTEQQIIGLEAEAGVSVTEFCRKHGFSDAAFYGWRGAMRGMGSIRGRGVDRGTPSGIE